MSTDFKSLKDLENYIKRKVEVVLEKDVSKDVVESLKEHAQSMVYDVYEPKEYERRFSFLRDESYQINKGDWSAEIKPIAEFNQAYPTSNRGNELAGLVNYGDGWNGHVYEYKEIHGAPPYNLPRQFLSVTYDELKDGHYAILLKNALQSQGLNVQ